MNKWNKIVSSAALGVALVLTAGLNPAAAAGPDAGLYGSTDPTFTGVSDQSLAILGLVSVGVEPSPQAINWLVTQQCLDGSFQAYRLSIRTACGPSDPVNFSGPDSNSTALAALALNSVGKIGQAKKAATWLSKAGAKATNGTTGVAYYPGAGALPDANSSGLAYAAMTGVGMNSVIVRQVRTYLFRSITPCTESGGAKFQSGDGGVNNSASAQVLFGLKALTPAEPANRLAKDPSCGKNKSTNLASYLSSQLKTGTLSNFPYDGDDYGNTAATVVTFNSMKIGKSSVNKSILSLKKNAKAWALKNGQVNAGAVGWLLMAAEATDSSPKKFGGMNLVTTLTKSMKK